MKGTYHRVGPGEDLMFLAEIYYGDSAAWGHIFWANWDVYGDDFEMIPAGSDVYIPDLEVGVQSIRLHRDIAQNPKRLTTPQETGTWEVRGVSSDMTIRVEELDSGEKRVLFRFNDKSVVMTGATGIEYAAERIITFYTVEEGVFGEIEDTPQDMLSNAFGDGSLWTKVPDVDEVAGLGTVGIPGELEEPIPEKGGIIPNLLRIAVEEYIGHHYYYFATLDKNGFTEGDIFKHLQRIKIPPRGKRHLIAEAGKWRKRLGYA